MNIRFLPVLPQPSSSPNTCYAIRFISHFSTRYPLRTLFAVYVLPIIALVFLSANRSFRVDNPTFSDYFLRDNERTHKYNARKAVRHQFDLEIGASSHPGAAALSRHRAILDSDLSFVLLFRMPSKSDNILTPSNIATMKRAEDIVFNNEKFPRICFRNDMEKEHCPKSQCALPKSILSSRDIYGYHNSTAGHDCRKPGYPRLDQHDITQFVYSLPESSEYAPCVGRSAFTQNTTWIAASYFFVGVPFGVDKPEVLTDSQMGEIYTEWITNLIPDLSKATEPHFGTYAYGSYLTRVRVAQAITKDIVFAAVALAVVALFIIAHTSSLFLALMTALQVFFSLPISFIIYWHIFNIPFFSVLQVFAIYLLVGIAADDVFVFTDAWKQSFVVLSSHSDLYSRMVWTYRRAVAAMTVTTLTTAFAFILLLTSPIMPIATLGSWAALIIMIQFIFVITAYPSVLVLWQSCFRNRSWPCFGFTKRGSLPQTAQQPADLPSRESNDDAENAAISTSGNIAHSIASCIDPVPVATPLRQNVTGSSERRSGQEETNHSVTMVGDAGVSSQIPPGNYRFVEQFFRDRWITVLFKIRYILLACAIAILLVCTVLACLLKTPDTEERPLRHQNPNEVAGRHMADELTLSTNSDFLEVRLVWGVLGINYKGTNYYDRDELGVPVMDESFDLKPKEAQEFLRDTCQSIRERDDLVSKSEADARTSRCWIEDFYKWRSSGNESGFKTYNNDNDLGFDILEFVQHQDRETGEQPYMKYVEDKDIIYSSNSGRVVATELRFLSKQRWGTPREVSQREYRRWEDVTNDLNRKAPSFMNNSFATAGYPWVFAITQETMLFSMRPGIGIMLAIAFIIMCVSTGSLTIAVLTSCAVGGVLGIMFGFLYIVGWDLGVAECLSAVISVGYAFDGVAHIGKAYAESDEGSREQRTRDALTALGISVLFGTLSTAASALMLLFTQVLMLFKFGVLVTVIMAATLLWALVFLPAGLLIFGPCEKDRRLQRFLKRVWRGCRACGNLNRKGNADDAAATESDESHDERRCENGFHRTDHVMKHDPCDKRETPKAENDVKVNLT